MSAIILVGGGSSSGKTYLTHAVAKALGEDSVTLLTLDDYYKDQANVPLEERRKANYDHPRAFDWPLMRRHILSLKEGCPIEKPTYDFVNHTRAAQTEVIIPKDVVIVEGIMALVDKQLRELGDLLVFINASNERRFLRRVIRDTSQRGRSRENVIHQYFETVQPMYDEIVKPSSMYADLIINNDGVANLAVDVLTVLFRNLLQKVENGTLEPRSLHDEFGGESLVKAWLEEKR